jgi:hypothetical protein
METLAFALKYVKQGLSVIPLKRGTKIPLLSSWEPYQRKLASNEQIEVWFSNGHAENNIAIVTGTISCIIAFDNDGEEASTRLNRAIESLDDEGLKMALKETMGIKTANGNTNIVIGFKEEEFTLDDKLIANRVLWTSGKHNEIRVKGEGGYIVAPPSTLADGKRYELIDGKSTVAILSKTQIDKLISAIRNQASPNIPIGANLSEEDVYNIVTILKPHYQHGNRNDFTMFLSGLMRKEGISFHSALKVVETIAVEDEEKSARIRTLEEAYKKEELDKVCGYSGLLSILVNQTQSEGVAKQILDEVGFAFTKQLIYRAVQENENGKEQHLASIQDRDYAEYVIETLKKTIKQEDSLVRQIVYTGLSAYADDPINLGIIAPTSEGKTYPVIESIKLFPKEDVLLIGKMSTKMLVRQKGVLVDENNEPLKPKIKQLKKDIEKAKKEKDKGRQEELNEQLEALSENARTIIQLRGKILVFLEPPECELWNLLKPILSHDSDEIEFPFVDKTERGFASRRIVVKGWPACIFCSAKDESNWPAWPEIVSRSLITSPNMNPEKYRESNLLIAQRKGLPRLIQQQVIVSEEELRLAKFCISHIKERIQKYSSKDPVWIPFSGILAEALPAAKGPDNRIAKLEELSLCTYPLALRVHHNYFFSLFSLFSSRFMLRSFATIFPGLYLYSLAASRRSSSLRISLVDNLYFLSSC